MKRSRMLWLCAPLLLAAVVFTICGLLALPGVHAGEPRYFAITNARIVTVSGPSLDGGTVLIEKGLIKAVGANVAIPPEALVIDGKGMTVYPGLIAAGPLPAEEGESTAAPRGRRAARDSGQPPSMGPQDRPGTSPWRAAADEVKPDEKVIGPWREAGFTSALVWPDGGMLPGQAAVVDLDGERASDLVVKTPAALLVSLKPTGNFWGFPGSLMGSIAYVHQVFIDTAWYAEAEVIYSAHPSGIERPPYDRTERVVGKALQANELVLIPANNTVQMRRAFRLAHEWGVRAALYGGQEGYAMAEELAAQKLPVIVNLKWPEKPKDADPEAETSLRTLRFRDRAPSTPAALEKARVLFAFYSEEMKEPKDAFKSIRKATAAGLSEDAALRALTLDAATIYGVSDVLGSIEPGKIANLVITDGDIFGEKTKVKQVFVDGKRFEVHEPPKEDKPDEKKDGKKPERKTAQRSAGAASAADAAQGGAR